ITILFPTDVLHVFQSSPTISSLVGLIFLCPVFLYIGVTLRGKGEFHLGAWVLPIPSTGLAVLSLLLGAIDWIIAAAVLYALLPVTSAPTFLHVVSAFTISQIIALISHVPSGLGVFEALMIYSLGTVAPPSTILGILILYRFVY